MTSDPKATDSVRVPVALDGTLLRQIVDKRFPRGVTDFLDHWHCADDARGKPYSKAPRNRATIYRWFQGDLPGSAETLIELAAILDIDPFCLITLAGATPSESTAKILTALETRLWQHKSMALIGEFLGRRADWPPKAIGARFASGWHSFDFAHDPAIRAGVYGNFAVRFPNAFDPDIPKVLHIAYRHKPHFGGRWLQFGMVRFLGKDSLLININGSTEIGSAKSASGPFTVETVFGLGPAEFRLASLTPFSAEASYEPSTDPGRVGFR